jgi:exosortase/archaeosortase family protein
MTSRRTRALLTVLGVCVFAAIGFVVLQEPVRALETSASAAILHVFGVDGIHDVGRTTLLVIPHSRAAFRVLITPSCSSIASLLAFGCLTPLVPGRTATGRLLAAATATLLIAAGNLVRITGSIAIGVIAGRGSLVLFHDWVGTMFTVVYTLGGYVLLLTFLLPRERSAPSMYRPSTELAHAR